MYFIGLMSGTSMDAIDTALVKFDDKAHLLSYHEYPINRSLRQQIRLLNGNSTLARITELDNQFGHLLAEAVIRILDDTKLSYKDIAGIGSHGPTIAHQPDGAYPTSIQIGDPNIIAAMTGITTITDFRRMDIAHTGQGAPLASGFHHYQFQQKNRATIILNIGGIANITLLAGDDVIGFDTGPGNALLDDWIFLKQKRDYDAEGNWARQGTPHKHLLERLLADDYFSAELPKSTGREYFNMDWLNKHLNKMSTAIKPEDVQATLLELSAISIVNAIKSVSSDIDEILVCGGGTNNPFLMERLQNLLGDIKVATTAKYGIAPMAIEAVAFAWLAKQRLDKNPANIPSVTGAKKPVLLGGIYSVE